jgi:hypothetical protein
MKRIASNPKRSWDVFFPLGGFALGLALLFGHHAFAGIVGPVVGFQRVEVGTSSQWIAPTIQPFVPDSSIGETKAQMLANYFGEELVAGSDADSSDWIGCANAQGRASSVTMIWRDQQGQWRDLLGNTLDPDCANVSGFWLDLVFGTTLSTNLQTRELVLSGQVVW